MAQTTREESFAGGRPAKASHSATLNKERYTGAAFMAREWEQIWSRCWLFAGLLSDIPETGDYFVYHLGPESVIVMRDSDSTVRAFYNVCQHRGNRLFGNEMGSVKQISCPYHGWRYGLDGVLQEVPDAERFCPAVDPRQRSLKRVRLETWAGMVWISLDPDAPNLAEYLGRVADNLAPYHFENMTLLQHQTVALDANWKTVRDNFLEQYHVDFIHPQHAGFVDCANSKNILWPFGHSATVVEGCVTNSRYPVPEEVPKPLRPLLESLGLAPGDFAGHVSQIRLAVQQRKRALAEQLGVDWSQLSDAQLTDVWQYDVFPNTFMTIQPEELWIYGPRPHPDDPNKCFFDKFTLQLPVEHARDEATGIELHPGLKASLCDERPEHESFTRDEVIAGTHSLTLTIDQDIYYLPDMQAGLRSKGFDSALLNQDETRLQHFHDWVDEWLARE